MNRFATLLCAALLSGTLPAAAQQQQGTQPARNRIEVDLRSTAATGTLPFDVPFEMVGNVPDRVERISLHYRPCHGDTCPKGVARNADCTPILDDQWSAPMVWERDALTTAAAGQPVRFALPVDPLDAQRRYVFVFDVEGSPTDDQIAAFQPRVRDVVSRHFAGIDSSDQPESFLVELRQNVIAEIRTIAPCIVTDEFLRATADVDQGFTDRFAAIRQAQERKAQNVDAFNRGAENLRQQLGAINESPLLTVVRRLRTLAATQPETAADLDAHADVIKLLSLGPAQFDVVARGASPSNPDRTLPSMTAAITADAATARANGLTETSNLLRDLSAWVKRLASDGTLNDLSADARTALQRAVDTASNQAFTMKNLAANIARQTGERDAAVTSIANAVHEQIRTLRFIGADTIGTYDTFANWYISADAGFAYAQSVESALPYLGVNVYFRPVNKDAPLRMRGGLGRRASATIALTLASVADNEKVRRQDLFGTQSLVLGGGFRVTDALRVGGGLLVYEKKIADPGASESTKVAAAPYVSMSFDWNVAKQFAGIGKLFQ